MKFDAFLKTMTDEQLGAEMRDRFTRLAEAHHMGLSDEHPADRWNADNAILRDHATKARDSTSGPGGSLPGNTASSKEVMDDPNAALAGATTRGARGGPREGATVAKDRALAADQNAEEFRIRQSGSANLEGELHLARLKRGGSTSASVATMDKLIPGYGRLK